MVAGLFVRSLQRAEQLDLGFDQDHLLTLRITPGPVEYDVDRTTKLFDDLERRVRALPGVEDVAFSSLVPLTYAFDACPIEPEGSPVSDEISWPAVGYNLVSADYFRTMRLPLMRGRPFS